MLVKANIEGDLTIDWDSLPEKVKLSDEVKERIFKTLESRYSAGDPLDSRVLFDINKYAIELVKKSIS